MADSTKQPVRVVITGIGWITPLGHDIDTVWQKLLAGQSAIGPIKGFDAKTFPTTFAAEVKDFDFTRYVKDPGIHQGIRTNSMFALAAAQQAWQNAGLESNTTLDRDRIGMYLGCGEGHMDIDNYIAANLAGWSADQRAVDTAAWAQTAEQKLNAVTEIEQDPNMVPAHLAMEFNIRGPVYNCLTACAASTQAIGEAVDVIRRDDADVMIAGGSHTMIHPFGVTGFNRLTALSNRNDDPATASRPFDLTRDGFVLGEGSGMLILETLEHARNRGANILAEVVGYGSSADAFRITDTHPEGRGAVAAMTQALADAAIEPTQINYISAHGTGTQENDSTETLAIKRMFGDAADQIPVSSIKSMMGHLIAAAGAVELITCVLAIRDGQLPPTMNLNQPDPECDLDYVPNACRSAEVNYALSNSFGFGGQNNTLIIKKFDD